MLILIGAILSLGGTLGTWFGFGFHTKSPWYLFLLLAFFITYFVVYLNIYWLIYLITIRKFKKIESAEKVNLFYLLNVRWTEEFILTINGIFVKKKGFKNRKKEAGLYLFNHISDYDPWAIYKIMGGRYAFVGKKALRNIPMVRCISSSIGTLYVDTGDKELNNLMVDNAVDYISNKETSVVIAPEGTRNFSGGILPFKHGGFHIAKRCKCPIFLLGINGMSAANKKAKLKIAKVQIECFGTIRPEEYEGLSAGEIALMCENKYKEYFHIL